MRLVLLVVIMWLAMITIAVPERERAEGSPAPGCSNTYAFSSSTDSNGVLKKDLQPPLSAKYCKDIYMKRMGQCWKSNGTTWAKSQSDKCDSAKSWLKVVDWKSPKNKQQVQKNATPTMGGYKRTVDVKIDNWDSYKFGDTAISIKRASECRTACDKDKAGCAAFTIEKKMKDGKYSCWMAKSGFTTSAPNVSKNWVVYARDGAASTDATSVVTPTGTALGGESVGNGNFYMRSAVDTPGINQYMKKGKSKCNDWTYFLRSGTQDLWSTFVFQDAGNGAYYIMPKVSKEENCEIDGKPSIYLQPSTYDTTGKDVAGADSCKEENKVRLGTWGSWVPEEAGTSRSGEKQYIFKASNCTGDAGYLTLNESNSEADQLKVKRKAWATKFVLSKSDKT